MDGRTDLPPDEIVTRTAQLAGLLDLKSAPDAMLLRQRLANVDPGAGVVLTPQEERAVWMRSAHVGR
ncbi:hypothetical protein [Planobispora longispora]|uniref:Uncharacterized protein n=1 Tax=Planobispora longispora TaxID=28887 RepID=A0A8J3W7X2_9ACTN|nr:hypothetical protein [Planobispora longispora]BFE80669.1 hypothetical protein GCM10020093_032700 [Planobispora longispora]GIH79310.1 hypothetical protein Plo01_57390 [Planobispora longispora]